MIARGTERLNAAKATRSQPVSKKTPKAKPARKKVKTKMTKTKMTKTRAKGRAARKGRRRRR
jgi:hypothetical protein